MEGPSVYLATEWLAPLVGEEVLSVDGNTRIGKDRLIGKKILGIFSWGKHLVFQFDVFAMRVHFLLFGSFEAIIHQKKVTGDYPTKNRPPRLVLNFDDSQIILYSCSIKFIETDSLQRQYDFSTDIMSSQFDVKKAVKQLGMRQNEELGDVLLDQTIFSGVGNIIKNEVLYLVNLKPSRLVKGNFSKTHGAFDLRSQRSGDLKSNAP